MTAAKGLNLKNIVSQLSTHYGPPRPSVTTDPFALILLENIAYLVEEKKNYAATYRTVQAAIKDQLIEDYGWLISAHMLLRQHGKEVCKTNRPLCEKCPVRKSCAYFATRA